MNRMDEMMRGQKGWRELAILGDKMDKVSGVIEGLLWSPRRGSDSKKGEFSEQPNDWPSEDVSSPQTGLNSYEKFHLLGRLSALKS